MTMIIDTPEGIDAYCHLARRGALYMEIKGMKRRGPSVASMIKQHYGLKGRGIKLLKSYEDYLEGLGIELEVRYT